MSIQDLINAASPGSIINIQSGLYKEQITIDKPLTLQGPSQSEPSATLDASDFESGPNIHILANNVVIRNLFIQDGPSHGILIGDENYPNLTGIMISDNHITGHGNAGILSSHQASITVDKNLIENNGQGQGFTRAGIILSFHGESKITNNTIINNGTDGIFAEESNSGLIIEGNLIENHTNSGVTLAWDEHYVNILNNDIKNCGSGNLDEQGGIVIIQSAAELIQGNTIKGCSPYGLFWGWVTAIGPMPDSILISKNEISSNSQDGIYLFSQGPGGWIDPDNYPLKPNIENNYLLKNGGAGIYVSNLYYSTPGNANPTVNNNKISNNVEWGIFNGTEEIIDATNNWWGDNSGPFNSLLNPSGKGNPVSENVDFSPWITKGNGIDIVECRVDSVQIIYYQICPLEDETSLLKLTFRLIGQIYMQVNDEIDTFPFEIIFNRRTKVDCFLSENSYPKLATTSSCQSYLINNKINVQINLCIKLDICIKKNINPLNAMSYCPNIHLNGDSQKNLAGKGQITNKSCISVDLVLARYKITENLTHHIPIEYLN